MTPERQKWWDSLPKREKYLRREISYLQRQISTEKFDASTAWSVTIRKIALKHINNYKAHIRALKRELDRTTVVTYIGCYEYRCKKCGGTFEDFGQPYCCWCGRKIEGVEE